MAIANRIKYSTHISDVTKRRAVSLRHMCGIALNYLQGRPSNTCLKSTPSLFRSVLSKLSDNEYPICVFHRRNPTSLSACRRVPVLYQDHRAFR